MANVLALHENYISDDHFSSMTYSSQKTLMPASNTVAGTRRTKVWRSDGQWEITSANKGIVLQEVDGVNQTVNIAESTYTTDTSFLAAVKAALDGAAGSAVYTVARDTSTSKIKITSDGGGGAVLKLMCTSGSFTAAATIGFSTASDLTGSLTYTADVLKIHTSEFLKWDFGTSVNPKAFILLGLRNENINISQTATVKLQGNATDSWGSPSYDVTLSYNRFAMQVLSTSGLHTSALRYWRLHIQDASNVNLYVEISNAYLGDFVSSTRGAVQFPLRADLVDLSQTGFGRSGVSYSDVVQLTEELSFSWELLTVAEKEALEDFAREVGTTTPFFICLDPNEYFSAESERHTRYVKFMDGPTFTLVSPNNFSSDWRIREEV
jgi:hypothetical protein